MGRKFEAGKMINQEHVLSVKFSKCGGAVASGCKGIRVSTCYRSAWRNRQLFRETLESTFAEGVLQQPSRVYVHQTKARALQPLMAELKAFCTDKGMPLIFVHPNTYRAWVTRGVGSVLASAATGGDTADECDVQALQDYATGTRWPWAA